MLASHEGATAAPGRSTDVLCCGLDSLDMNVYVRWAAASWPKLAQRCEELKQRAAGTSGLRCDFADCLILPSGRPMYRWHLQWPEFHCYLQNARVPSAGNGNVYVSVGARTLWQGGGIDGAVARILRRVSELGGSVYAFKLSRCDLAADVQLPAPLCEEYLTGSAVPSNLKNNAHRSGDRLETIYFGGKESPVRLRIYDKSLELTTNPEKWWMTDVWGIEGPSDVWRFEFQLRRAFLKSVGIDSVNDCTRNLASCWHYLTHNWFSLRTSGDRNVTRREPTQLWKKVQSAGTVLGTASTLTRSRSRSNAGEEWYISRSAGLLASFAALRGGMGRDEALETLSQATRDYWTPEAFDEEVRVRCLKKGLTYTKESEGELQ